MKLSGLSECFICLILSTFSFTLFFWGDYKWGWGKENWCDWALNLLPWSFLALIKFYINLSNQACWSWAIDLMSLVRTRSESVADRGGLGLGVCKIWIGWVPLLLYLIIVMRQKQNNEMLRMRKWAGKWSLVVLQLEGTGTPSLSPNGVLNLLHLNHHHTTNYSSPSSLYFPYFHFFSSNFSTTMLFPFHTLLLHAYNLIICLQSLPYILYFHLRIGLLLK